MSELTQEQRMDRIMKRCFEQKSEQALGRLTRNLLYAIVRDDLSYIQLFSMALQDRLRTEDLSEHPIFDGSVRAILKMSLEAPTPVGLRIVQDQNLRSVRSSLVAIGVLRALDGNPIQSAIELHDSCGDIDIESLQAALDKLLQMRLVRLHHIDGPPQRVCYSVTSNGTEILKRISEEG